MTIAEGEVKYNYKLIIKKIIVSESGALNCMFLTNLSLKTTVSNIPELKDYKCIFVQIIYFFFY